MFIFLVGAENPQMRDRAVENAIGMIRDVYARDSRHAYTIAWGLWSENGVCPRSLHSWHFPFYQLLIPSPTTLTFNSPKRECKIHNP